MTNRESIKKMFPNLVKELENGENKVQINSVRANLAKAEEAAIDSDETMANEAETALPDKFRHYNPTVIDFIRRCDTQAQAEEIIEFLERKGEITLKNATAVRSQLKKEGLRSFGPKKEDNYYFRQSGYV